MGHHETSHEIEAIFPPTRYIHNRSDEWLQSGTMLARLRRLAPARPMTVDEAFWLAERQATHLLAVCGVDHAPVPVELIRELSGVRVKTLVGIPVAGASVWNGSGWIITLEGAQSHADWRFTLAHEFKHVVDYSATHARYVDDDISEHVADYFARCVLMPRAWIKLALGRPHRSRRTLCTIMGVTPAMLTQRLEELGLAKSERCRRRMSWVDVSQRVRLMFPSR